ncbi:PEP-CTERM sorting domain-containing protein [Pontiellaceae bacterium B12219]|nr:PEP-CTERM sorting domain-containing protein [Pontiellaceae bacterium B12219]
MKHATKIKRLPSTIFTAALCLSSSFSDVLITDFETTNPMNFSYPSETSTWDKPVDQFQSFTDGDVSGQEVLPIGEGAPTASGGAGRLNLALDLSGTRSLELTARLLPSNEARVIQVLLFNDNGTIEKFNFYSSSFNSSTFTTARVDFDLASTTETVSGLDLSAITAYEIQGNYWDTDGSKDAAFNVQFDNLNASLIPEPSSIIMVTLASASLLMIRRRFLI